MGTVQLYHLVLWWAALTSQKIADGQEASPLKRLQRKEQHSQYQHHQQHSKQQRRDRGERSAVNATISPYAIAMCSGHTALSTKPDMQKVFENHRQYAAKHNYTYLLQTVPLVDDSGKEVAAYWTKISLIKKLLRPPHTFDWVFWIDSDAIVVNMAQSIENLLHDPTHNIVLESSSRPVTSLIFSGDTNAINDGVLLFRRTDYSHYIIDEVIKIGAKLDAAGVRIGMGADNAAFSIFLGGCNSSMQHSTYQQCFDRVNLGFNQETVREIKPVKKLICAGDRAIYAKMIEPSILLHVAPLPQRAFQGYSEETAQFVIHFPGPRPNKFEKLSEVLATIKPTRR